MKDVPSLDLTRPPAHGSLIGDRPLWDVRVNVFVERPSQKAIIIGRKGTRLAAVGARARAEIEPLLGSRVFLSLHVRVAKEWQRDPKQLGRLGF